VVVKFKPELNRVPYAFDGRGRKPITFEKIGKRWYLVTPTKETFPVKYVESVRPGMKA
jgi:hypothetical protein